jgi:hypothetical protein
MDELVSIPEKFDLPVVWGHVSRVSLAPGGALEARIPIKPVVHGQMLAFVVASKLASDNG